MKQQFSWQEGAERPLECGECRRPVEVYYTEIIGGVTTRHMMCKECPHLKKRLSGNVDQEEEGLLGEKGLACGSCGSSLASLKVGTPLGCEHCYTVFEVPIIEELSAAHKIPPSKIAKKNLEPLHRGRERGQKQEVSPLLRLLALNEALDETLSREDYEQAAWLRDQIKQLRGGEEGQKDGE